MHISPQRNGALRQIIKPTPDEFRECRHYLERELTLLKNLKCVVALASWRSMRISASCATAVRFRSRTPYAFGHNVQYEIPGAADFGGLVSSQPAEYFDLAN